MGSGDIATLIISILVKAKDEFLTLRAAKVGSNRRVALSESTTNEHLKIVFFTAHKPQSGILAAKLLLPAGNCTNNSFLQSQHHRYPQQPVMCIPQGQEPFPVGCDAIKPPHREDGFIVPHTSCTALTRHFFCSGEAASLQSQGLRRQALWQSFLV